MTAVTKQKRHYFRLTFPRQGRLHLKTLSGEKLPIVDISEKGLKLEYESAQHLPLHQAFDGEISFHSGSKTKVAGKVIRKDSRGTALLLEQGIEARELIREQHHIMHHYPMFLEARHRARHFA